MGQNLDKIALSLMVKEIEAFCVFAVLAKIQKFKMAAIFENFFKKLTSIVPKHSGG